MLILIALIAAIFLFVVVPGFLSQILTHGGFNYPDPNNGKAPISYGLKSRWAEFKSSDGITLRGWYIPSDGPARGTIIYCHGLNRSKVEMLPRAQFGHQLGYNGLLFDLRHHGQSGGKVTSLGYYERLDVLGAVRYALEVEKAERPIILWGVSMGAVASLMAAADSPDVSAVISDSAFLSLADTVRHHWKLLIHLPAFPIADETLYAIGWRAGFPPGDLDSEKAVEHIGLRPILFVAAQGDRRMPPAIAEELYSHAQSPSKKLVILPGTRHGEGFNQARDAYELAVKDFLTQVKAR
ncbi:MAG: alpha/beta hydrolase [Acidobacteria bacterium]|nr:alpha/beta hydrolase [Acidobacteriota bacterium]